MLNWANRFNICCFLDSHQYQFKPYSEECLLAADALGYIRCNAGNAFEQLQQFHKQTNDWIFGHLGYDLKNELEVLESSKPDYIQFPDMFFFQPRILIRLTISQILISVIDGDPATVFNQILSVQVPATLNANPTIEVRPRMHKDEYLSTIRRLQEHILRGDCYEINYCQEFYAAEALLNPIDVNERLSKSSPNPFSAYYKLDSLYCLCASPERFLKKTGSLLISQPIKGTKSRKSNDPVADELNRRSLQNSDKDKAENVMTVDLVRNDLSKICEEASVNVEELFTVYSFPNVHQMISTISGKLRKELGWLDSLKALFPMASMTGAPKKRVMELIERYELSQRGLFSGSIGYVDPAGDFDFNVVIRSLLYNQATKYLSYHTGSAITFASDPYEEYEECLLKGQAIKKVLES